MHRVVSLLVTFSLLVAVGEACFAWGGCGFGGCGGCGLGRICRKAHGAKTLKELPVESSGDPDTDFRNCCEASGIPSACFDKCNYKRFTKDAMVKMFLRLDECPVTAAVEMQRCATRGADHTDCCKRNAVHTTLAGDKCLIFCKEDAGNATLLDVSYIPCLERFDSVNSCFWHDAVREIAEADKMIEEKIDAHEDQEVSRGSKQIVRPPPIRSEGDTSEERRFVGIQRDQRDEVREHTSKWELAKRRMLEETGDDEEYEEFVGQK